MRFVSSTLAAASATADAAAGLQPRLELIAQLRGVLGGEVDLIADAVESEFHRLVCGTLAVEIIDQRDSDFFGHSWCFLLRAMNTTRPSGTNVPQKNNSFNNA